MNANAEAIIGQIERLTYSTREACTALGVSPVTLWRLEKRGLLRPVAGLRTKLWPITELKAFVEGRPARRITAGAAGAGREFAR